MVTSMRPMMVRFWLVVLLFCAMPVTICSAADDEFDNAKWKLELNGWVSSPSGYFNGTNGNGYFDLQRDFGFGNYATFNGRLDWRFKRKHHLLLSTTPVVASRTTTLTRTIDWQGETFVAGAQATADIKSLIFTPGYQYDFFRLRQISLGILVNVNLAYTSASLKASASVTGGSGSTSATVSSSGSLFAPLPAVGPTFRWYPIPNFSRLYLDGAATGMTFFGYGNFVSGNALLGVPLSRHWDARAGYLLGSRLKVTGSDDRIAVRLTQKGPVFGVIYQWGTR